MKNVSKKIMTMVLALGLVIGVAGVGSTVGATTVTKYYSVTPTSATSVTIKNANTDNSVTVTYSAYPDSSSYVARVEIYKNSGFSGTAVSTSTFNSGNKHTVTFTLPANKTYYAKISPADGNSFSGTFVATY